jgi:polar amino acid transport system substrate-binding protein
MDDLTLSRREMLKRATAAGFALPLTGGLLAACGDDAGGGAASGGPGLLSQLERTGIARIAIANEPPYTEVKPDGTVTGAEPELARAILKRMGIGDVQGVVTPYEAMIPGLKARRWDMITAGLFMKQSRCAEILYSEPTVVSTESYAVKPGNPQGLATIADIKSKDVKIGVLPGGFEDGILETEQIPTGKVVKVQDGRSGIEALGAGRVDAFLLPTLSLEALKKGGEFEITEPIEDAPVTGAGHGFRKQDKEFRDAYNAAYKEIKDAGELEKILQPWGFSADAAMSTSTAELCKTEG